MKTHKNQWYRFSLTDETVTYERSGKSVSKPVQEKIYFTDYVVDAFSLEPREKVPFDQNFTAVPNYFLDYWGYILGMDAAYTWIRYVRHVYRTGFELTLDTSKMAKFMGLSHNTLKKYLSILESYGFAAVFYKDTKVMVGNREQLKTLVRVKVRKSTPLLSPDLVRRLPIELQRYHSNDILELEKSKSIVFEEMRSIDAIFGLNQLKESTGCQNLIPENADLSTGCQNLIPSISEGDIHTVSNFDITPYQNLTPLENESIKEKENNLINNATGVWIKILHRLEEEISTTALNTFFMPLKPDIESCNLIISSDNPVALTWAQERYGDILDQVVKDLNCGILNIRYRSS